MNLPKWAWFVIGLAVVLIIIAVLKINVSVGSNGISMSQGLVK